MRNGRREGEGETAAFLVRGFRRGILLLRFLMNVTLKPELQRFVAEKTGTGQFADASAVVNEALALLREEEEFTGEQEAVFRREVRRGLEQLDKGQVSKLTTEEIIAEERARLAGGRGGD